MARKVKAQTGRFGDHKKKGRQGASNNTKRNQGKKGTLKKYRGQGNRRRRVG